MNFVSRKPNILIIGGIGMLPLDRQIQETCDQLGIAANCVNLRILDSRRSRRLIRVQR